jgi:hypothetical protein
MRQKKNHIWWLKLLSENHYYTTIFALSDNKLTKAAKKITFGG